MAISNGSFEFAGTSGGEAAGWDVDAVTQAELWANFDAFLDDGQPVHIGFEDWRDYIPGWHDSFDGSDPAGSEAGESDDFETGWSNEPYFTELPDTVEPAAFDPTPETFESFEVGWSNVPYYTQWSGFGTITATFFNPTPQIIESFEGAWSSNQNYWWDYGDASWSVAQFNTTLDAFEDFETEWPTEIASSL